MFTISNISRTTIVDLKQKTTSTRVDLISVYSYLTDFDGDNFLGRSDLETTLKALTQNSLKTEEVKFVLDQVI